MRKVPSTTGPDGYGEIRGETGYSSASSQGKAFNQELIGKANTVPLIRVFKSYNVPLTEFNRKITCPFRTHQGGNESTPSFYYYPDSNSFYCYGCGVGGKHAHACEFVAAMEGISRTEAAQRVLEKFPDDVGDVVLDGPNFEERLEIMMDFANSVRNFRQSNLDSNSISFIEEVCRVYDAVNIKRNPDNEALRRLVELLKEQIAFYT